MTTYDLQTLKCSPRLDNAVGDPCLLGPSSEVCVRLELTKEKIIQQIDQIQVSTGFRILLNLPSAFQICIMDADSSIADMH